MTDDATLQHRAKYHPVEDVTITIAHTASGRRTQAIAKRCKMHAHLWDGLTDAQQAAAERIDSGWRAEHNSLAPAIDYSRAIEPRGGGMPDEIRQALVEEYRAWQGLCLDNGIDYHLAVRICAEGETINGLSTSGHRRTQMTKRLHDALDVMAKMKGYR